MSTEFDIVAYSEYVVDYYANKSVSNGTEFYSAFDNVILVMRNIVDVIKGMILQWYGGVTFNLWYVMIGFLVISIVVSMILRMPGVGSLFDYGKENNRREGIRKRGMENKK